MANTLLTIAMITEEALMVLENNLTFTKQVDRQYDSKFGVSGAKIGTVLNIRLPVQYVYSQGQGLQLQDVTETSVPLVLTTQYQRSFIFSSQDLALSIDDFSKRFVKPAVASMANQIDGDGLQLYKSVYNVVGTPGSTPTDLQTYLNAKVKLANSACPMDDALAIVIDPQSEATLVNNLKGLFQQSSDIARQYADGTMGRSIGFKWSMDQNVASGNIGAWTGSTPTVTTAPANGATSIVTGGWATTTAVLNAGDVIYFAGVNSVNPQSRADTGQLQGFVVTTNVTSGGGGAATIPVSPAFNATGAFQNITALPAANAVITVYGASGQLTRNSLAFHEQAFTFACADLEMPTGVDMAARMDAKPLNVSLRLVRAYDINTDRFPTRLDLLGGWAAIRPQLACRIAS